MPINWDRFDMRLVFHLLFVYFILVVQSVVWNKLPFEVAPPHVAALSALYLGLVGRRNPLLNLIAAVGLGYVAELVFGYPKGVMALSMGMVCMVGTLLQGTMRVRGRLFMAILSAMVSLFSSLSLVVLVVLCGRWDGNVGQAMIQGLSACVLTGIIGPAIMAVFRHIDAVFARTQRDRLAALEGLVR